MPRHAVRTLGPLTTFAIVAAITAAAAGSDAPPLAHATARSVNPLAQTADAPAWIVDLVAQFGGAIGAMAVDEGAGADRLLPDVVWIGRGPRVEAVVVTDLAHPVRSGRTPWLDGPVVGLALRDGLAVAVAAGAPGRLYTVDVRDHAAPHVLGAASLTEPLGAIDVQNGFAFAVWRVRWTDADGTAATRPTVAVVDVRDPAAPVVLDDDLYGVDDRVRDVRIVGAVLAVAVQSQTAPFQRRVDLYDVAQGVRPRLIASHPDDAACHLGVRDGGRRDGGGDGVGDGGASDHVLWMGGGGIVALDISDPSAPRTIRRLVGDRLDDRLCYAAGNGLLQVDADGAPFAVWQAPYRGRGLVAMANAPDADGRRPAYWLDVGLASGAALIGHHAFVPTARGDVLAIDTRRLSTDPDPDAQAAALSGRLEGLGELGAIGVREDDEDGLLYAALREGGFRVLSLLQPLDPRIVGIVDDPYKHRRVHVAGGMAAVSNEGGFDSTVQHADVYGMDLDAGAGPGPGPGDPAEPRHLFHSTRGNFAHLLPRPGGPWLVSGPLSRLRPLRDDLTLVPVAEPGGPRQSSIPFDLAMTDIDTDGDTLVAVGVDGRGTAVGRVRLDAWAIADPRRPLDRGSALNVAFNAAEYHEPLVELSGRYAYVATAESADARDDASTSRLTVVDLEPAAPGSADTPRVRGSIVISGTITDLTVADGYVFARTERVVPSGDGITSASGAIHVVDVHDAFAPRVVGRLLVDAYGRRDSMAVRDGRVYVAGGETGVWVFEPPLAWEQPRGSEAARLGLPWVGRSADSPSFPAVVSDR